MPEVNKKNSVEIPAKAVLIRSIKSCIISLAAFMVISALFAFFSLKSQFLLKNMSVIGYCIAAICSMLSGYLSSIGSKYKGIVTGSVSAVIMMALIYIVLLIASEFCFSQKSAILIPLIYIFAVSGAIVSKNKNHGNKRRKK